MKWGSEGISFFSANLGPCCQRRGLVVKNQEVKEAESSRRPLQIIGTVGAKLLLTKAREEEIKRPVLFHTCKGQKEGVKRSGRWCWWRKGHEEKRKKKSL